MERERTASRAQEQILEQVRAQEPKGATEKAITLRRLPSKDYQIVMATEESKQTLDKADDWLRVIAPSARVKRTTYTVWVHGVRVQAVDAGNQEEAIATIRKSNERLHPELDIVRVAWSSRTLAAGKRFGSLIAEMGSIEAANRLISLGLVHEGEIKYCERFIKEARVIQCIRCNQFGHTMRVCRNRTTCGACAGDHHTRDCQRDGTARKCALCKGSHPAWAKNCMVRLREVERADIALRTTPAYYGRGQYQATPPPASNQRQVAGAPRSLIRRQDEDSEGWQTVAKGRKGRPSQLSVAASAASQTRIETRGLKRPRHDSAPAQTQDTEAEADATGNTQALLLVTNSQC
jgi:hypothetical protein